MPNDSRTAQRQGDASATAELIETVGEFHKIVDLTFSYLPLTPEELEASSPAELTYRSPAHSADTPSCYYVAVIGGEWCWVRYADHWNEFSAFRADLGRRVAYCWRLTGGPKSGPAPVYGGYVPVAELLAALEDPARLES